jgi:hypothetical protein
MAGHWPKKLGGWTLQELHAANMSYSTLPSEHAHMRTQVELLKQWEAAGHDPRAEYALPFEDPTWSGRLAADVFVLPNAALGTGPVIFEVGACCTWCAETQKYVHDSALFGKAVTQADRKRRKIDGIYAHLAANGPPVPPTRAFVVVSLCAGDHKRCWAGAESLADLLYVTGALISPSQPRSRSLLTHTRSLSRSLAPSLSLSLSLSLPLPLPLSQSTTKATCFRISLLRICRTGCCTHRERERERE